MVRAPFLVYPRNYKMYMMYWFLGISAQIIDSPSNRFQNRRISHSQRESLWTLIRLIYMNT